MFLQACAISTNLKPSGEINLTESNDVVIERIMGQAKLCWEKRFHVFQDAVRVRHAGYMILLVGGLTLQELMRLTRCFSCELWEIIPVQR
jgi:hypothetical protein